MSRKEKAKSQETKPTLLENPIPSLPPVPVEPLENKLEFIPVSEPQPEWRMEEEPMESSHSEEESEVQYAEPIPSPPPPPPSFLRPSPPSPSLPKISPSPSPLTPLKRPRDEPRPSAWEQAKNGIQMVGKHVQTAKEYLPDPNSGYMSVILVVLTIFAKNFLPKILNPDTSVASRPSFSSPDPVPLTNRPTSIEAPRVSNPSINSFSMF